MTEQEHLEQIARMCREIGDDLTHMKRLVADLETLYGIMICDTYIQNGCGVHVYAGIELLERALKKVAKEGKKSEFGNVKKTIQERNVEWFQLAKVEFSEYLKANHNRRAVIDLCAGGANNDKP